MEGLNWCMRLGRGELESLVCVMALFISFLWVGGWVVCEKDTCMCEYVLQDCVSDFREILYMDEV